MKQAKVFKKPKLFFILDDVKVALNLTLSLRHRSRPVSPCNNQSLSSKFFKSSWSLEDSGVTILEKQTWNVSGKICPWNSKVTHINYWNWSRFPVTMHLFRLSTDLCYNPLFFDLKMWKVIFGRVGRVWKYNWRLTLLFAGETYAQI